MANEDTAYCEAVAVKRPNAEKVVGQATPMGAWSYGFHDGWLSAMDAKFDDRKVLRKWHQASKHVFCPCTSDDRCNHNCSHGHSVMSGHCSWCATAFNDMENEK